MVTGSVTDGVRLAPAVTGWPGVAPGWSRRITVSGHTWHYFDNAASLPDSTTPRGTLLCVHGNPTWSYLWRSVLDAGARAGWRVVAVDQLEMGFSEHTGADHRLADRVRQLGDLTDTLGLSGDGWDGLGVVILGHDWGGVVSTGWAVDHPRELAGLALTNTAIHQPTEVKVPSLLRLARRPGVHSVATTLTPAFLDVTLRLARPPLADEVMRAYRSPYRTAHDRHGIGAFVADIPVDAAHPSHRELARIAAGVAELTVPALLIWGAKDPVFDERYLRDLIARLPHADVHRFSDAGHLVVEDADVAGTVMRWLAAHALPSTTAELASSRPISSADLPSLPSTTAARHSRAVPKATAPSSARSVSDEPAPYRPVYGALLDQAGSDDPAIVALHAAGRETVSWSELASRVHHLALGLNDAGVRPGHRVSLLVPPGVDLTTALFACLRLGAVVILADAGLGTRGLTLAVRGSAPDHIIGIERALVGARLLRWPGRRLLSEPRADGAATRPERVQARRDATTLGRVRRRALGLSGTVEELLARGAELAAGGATLPPEPDAHADAAILFTSGSTGPAKGVVYTHERLFRMCAAVSDAYGLSRERGLVAGFAPFSLLGTGLGALTSIPDMDVSAPATLTAGALADAVAAIGAYAVFASPSALANVVRTEGDLSPAQRAALADVRLFLSAGAPISSDHLARVGEVMPNADPHTPYGMTEVLPLTDVSLAQIRLAEADATTGAVPHAGGGTCVGRPLAGAQLRIVGLDGEGRATGQPTDSPGVTGEILVTAPNLKDRYDRLWATEAHSTTWPGWHRTDDVGHLDGDGRLWIEGRLAHVIVTAEGVLTPVQLENDVTGITGVLRAAVVAVGPVGTQQVVVVVETDPEAHAGARRPAALAPAGLTRAVRAAVGVPVAAVLRVPQMPTDVRHNSKLERTRLADWATRVLAGGRMVNP